MLFLESWVHIASNSRSGSQGGGTPGSVTPQLNVEEYLRLLREAQRESNESSARVSPRSSPKSPPNSPVQGTPFMEWQSYYVNAEPRHVSANFPKLIKCQHSQRKLFLAFLTNAS